MPDAVMGERGGRGSGGLWTRLLRGVVLPAGDRAFGQRMMERLRFLEEAQWWDPERIEAERRRSLASLLDVAYAEVPFYRDLLDHARVRPRDAASPETLSRIRMVTNRGA